MGQGESLPAEPPSKEELSLRLTNTFAEKCLTPLELYCFKSVFKSLAETESGLRYWSETTLARFLELPDALNAGPIIFQLCSYLGAFPFPSHAPAILTNDALLRVVVILAGRHAKVLRGGKSVWHREIWRGCAVFDKVLSPKQEKDGDRRTGEGDSAVVESKAETIAEPEGDVGADTKNADKMEEHTPSTAKGFAVDQAVDEDDEGLEYEEDEMVLAAFESMDAVEVFKQGEKADVLHAMIPSSNFLRLLELFLLIAPLGAQENTALYGTQLDEERLEGLRHTANCILASFGIKQNSGISYRAFDKVMSAALPYLFDAFQPLFEHFLFSKDVDNLHAHKAARPESAPTSPVSKKRSSDPPKPTVLPTFAPEPLLPVPGDIMDLNILNQLSFIFSGRVLFRNLQPLYLGHQHGFSMGQFEKRVFKWQAPSIFLVSGTLLPPAIKSSHARNFVNELSHHGLTSSIPHGSEGSGRDEQSRRMIYGAYVPVPWKATHKGTFSTSKTLLFQLSPVHDVFPASEVSKNYAYFDKPPATYSGLGFGSPLPNHSSSVHMSSSSYGSSSFSGGSSWGASSSYGSGTQLTRRSSLLGDEHIPLGPVSLHVDDALEFAAFTHLSGGGGSFHTSKLPPGARAVSDWQDRFEIEALEVWGVGDAELADAQKKAWTWEEREAAARRRVNLGTGDIEADRELLRLAGLVGAGERSGGSMG